MKGVIACAVFGAIVSGTVWADDTATISPGGISLYAASSKGFALVKGSPFVPSTPIRGGQPCGSAITKQPTMLLETQDHSTVYALYAPCVSSDALVKYKVASSGLTEAASLTSTIFPTIGNHINRPESMTQGPQNSLIIYYSPGASTFTFAAALYNSSLNALITASGYEDTDGTLLEMTSLQVDPSGKYYYVCAAGSGRTSVSVYAFNSTSGNVLTTGGGSYSDVSSLISRSTDVATISAFCPQ